MTAASLSDWAAFLSLGIGVHAGFSVFYFLAVDADSAAELNPWPVLRHACEDGRLVPLWQAVVHAGHDVNRAAQRALREHDALRQAAVTAAALLLLLSPVAPEASR